jgi:tryptophan synthase alpha chain
MAGVLATLITRLKSEKKTAFIPYITAGDPHLEGTVLFVEALAAAGANIIELGVPFSDPMADGPVNQRAAERALKSGTTLKKILECVLQIRQKGIRTPIVLFTYYNPVFAFGLNAFAHQAKVAGVTGVLCLDLPPEEATEYRKVLGSVGIETIFLAAPTTDDARLSVIDKASTGFVYYVSRTGVTGARQDLPPELEQEVKRIKRVVKNPVAVGFGISTPVQAAGVALHADAVVVGSAVVKIIEENPQPSVAADKIRQFVSGLVKAIQP